MIFHPLEKDYLPYIFDISGKVGKGSQMKPNELAFLASILDKGKPKKVLEVGVANGGTTCLLLDMLNKQGQNAFLYSVDLNKKYYCDKTLLTGHRVAKYFPELMSNWKLSVGDVLPAYMDEIGGDIDLVILDTAHVLPGELLDFPVFLPFLRDGAWVILHDTNLFTYKFRHTEIATKVVFDTVVAEKYLYYEELNGEKSFPNIAAFKVGQDTRKYISNCFTAMAMPWSYVPSIKQRDLYKNFYQKHYDEELVELFDLAYEQNCRGVKNRAEEKHELEKKLIANGIEKAVEKAFKKKSFFRKIYKFLFGKK